MQVTEGRGADVVLNSLAGELLRASWTCVAENGIMIELGKRDILGHGALDMTPSMKNRAYFGVDLLEMHLGRPDIINRLKKTVDDWIGTGAIQPIRPITTYQAKDVAEAFRYMQTGSHMGEILVQMPDDQTEITVSADNVKARFSGQRSYLLIGGFGGLGKSICLWMVENGVRYLTFLSRSARKTPEDQGFVRELEALGCTVTVVNGSVSSLGDVRQAVSLSPKPLAGVMHMGLVFKDQHFLQMTHVEWEASLAPKVQGTWCLHQAQQEHKLDFFVLFGSLAGVMGKFGQVNYAAANSFLESFARHRRSLVLPCSVPHPGPVEDVGMVSRDAAFVRRLKDSSIRLLTENEVMEGVALAIQQSGVGPVHSEVL
ncbi:KR domain-containing protein [Aspergillus germanicus]